MSMPYRQFVDGPFGQVHVRISEPKKATKALPLVCLHQSPKSSREFLNLMKYLGDDRTVIAIDSPGHGESDLPTSQGDATISTYAQSAWAALDALQINKVDLLGNHTGSLVAAEMATQCPARVRRIIMISAPVNTTEEIEEFKSFFQPIPLDEAGTRFHEAWARALQHRGPGVTLEELAFSVVEHFRAGEAYEWGHQAAFAHMPTFVQQLEALDHRIIVMNPGDLLFEATHLAKPLLKNGEVIDYPEWGMGFIGAFPSDSAKAVLSALI